MEQSEQSKKAFEKHIRTHYASLMALCGATTPTHAGMIESALRGTWVLAQKSMLEEQHSNVPPGFADGED